MTVKERLKVFISSKNLSVRSFEAKCKLANGLVNNITESISKNTIDKVSNFFPELNFDWLLTGEGQMLKTEENKDLSNIVNTRQSELDYYKSQLEMIRELLKEKERYISMIQPLADQALKEMLERNKTK